MGCVRGGEKGRRGSSARAELLDARPQVRSRPAASSERLTASSTTTITHHAHSNTLNAMAPKASAPLAHVLRELKKLTPSHLRSDWEKCRSPSELDSPAQNARLLARDDRPVSC